MANLIGQSFGRYHILEQLGEGGMAVVYKAFDIRLERNVAIKVILPGKEHSEKFLKRFEREAKSLAQLSHPNIVKVIDYGEHKGLPYLVMEYLPGGTLKQKLAGKPIPWQEAARILIPIARALAYAHESKIIHRDIKPSNILITQSGEPMLSDFGIAKMLEVEETLDLTGTGVGVGTPEYMSPEQAQGQPVDGRSDVYSLGVVFYEMVTGRKPYQADTPIAVVYKLASQPLPRPKDFCPDLPDVTEQTLLKALAKREADRFQDMAAFTGSLEKLLEEDRLNRKPYISRKRSLIVAVWVLGISIVVAILLSGWQLFTRKTAAVSSTAIFLPECNALKFSVSIDKGLGSHRYAYLLYWVSREEPVTIPQNSFLEYDVFTPATSPTLHGGVDLTGGTLYLLRDFADFSIVDEEGLCVHPGCGHPPQSKGRWYPRKFDLDKATGKTFWNSTLTVDLGAPDPGEGNYVVFYRNIYITDGEGKVLVALFQNENTVPYVDRPASSELDPYGGADYISNPMIEVVPCDAVEELPR